MTKYSVAAIAPAMMESTALARSADTVTISIQPRNIPVTVKATSVVCAMIA